MITPKRLRFARFTTPDLDRQVDYYSRVVGLAVVAEEPGRAFLATEAGQTALVFERGPVARLSALALDLAPGVDLPEAVRRLGAQGVRAELRSDVGPDGGQIACMTDLEGRSLEFWVRENFDQRRDPPPGVNPLRLGHVACYTRDPQAAASYYSELLGFRVSDWIEDRFVFMRCGYDHHTVNFARGEEARLHHMAFELRDAAHMHRACDILGALRIPVLWGPVRHGPGHNVAFYHRDPDGHVVEMYYGMDLIDDELGYFDPRPWHRDRPQRPKVWVGLPRDVWGGAPPPELPEFYRPRSPA